MKYKNTSPNVLRFSLGAHDYTVRAGGQVTVPAEHAEHPYIAGLLASGVLEEKAGATVQTEDHLSSNAGTTDNSAPASTGPAATTPAKAVAVKTTGK